MVQCDPRVGRQVHYVSRGSADGIYPAVCRCAHVTAVSALGPADVDPFSDRERMDLCVSNPEGFFFNAGVAHDQEGKAPGTWHWPEREAVMGGF